MRSEEEPLGNPLPGIVRLCRGGSLLIPLPRRRRGRSASGLLWGEPVLRRGRHVSIRGGALCALSRGGVGRRGGRLRTVSRPGDAPARPGSRLATVRPAWPKLAPWRIFQVRFGFWSGRWRPRAGLGCGLGGGGAGRMPRILLAPRFSLRCRGRRVRAGPGRGRQMLTEASASYPRDLRAILCRDLLKSTACGHHTRRVRVGEPFCQRFNRADSHQRKATVQSGPYILVQRHRFDGDPDGRPSKENLPALPPELPALRGLLSSGIPHSRVCVGVSLRDRDEPVPIPVGRPSAQSFQQCRGEHRPNGLSRNQRLAFEGELGRARGGKHYLPVPLFDDLFESFLQSNIFCALGERERAAETAVQDDHLAARPALVQAFGQPPRFQTRCCHPVRIRI